jgi:transcriptional regulator with XRE-family HTH domain
VTVTVHPPRMPGSESVATLGARRSALLRQRIAGDLVNARINGALSLREVARRVGISVDRLKRAEVGDPSALTIDLAARIAPIVGLQLAASLYLNGDPARDRAQLALLQRFRPRLHPSLGWRTEVPMPISGDLRGADGLIDGDFGSVLVEAETRLTDLQAVERKALLKKRDLGADRLIVLIADTPNNRKVLRLHPELRERFPIGTRKCLAALGRGEDPGGDCLVVL